MAKKSAVPEDVMYKNFNVACPYRTGGRHLKPINATVRCKDDKTDPKHGYPSHCPNCGWNPEVTKRRLTKMVGEKMALKLIAQSEQLAVQTRKKINDGGFPYDV